MKVVTELIIFLNQQIVVCMWWALIRTLIYYLSYCPLVQCHSWLPWHRAGSPWRLLELIQIVEPCRRLLWSESQTRSVEGFCLGGERERETESTMIRRHYLPLSGIVSKAATALMADLFNSSCFSNSCFTEFAFAFDCIVALSGSINFSIPKTTQREIKGSWSIGRWILDNWPTDGWYVERERGAYVAVERQVSNVTISLTTKMSTSKKKTKKLEIQDTQGVLFIYTCPKLMVS